MNILRENFKKLAKLQIFDRNAFVGDEKVSQALCNFVLTLSLVYNDYKNYFTWYHILLKSPPETPPAISREWGEFEGMRLHAIRIHIGFIHELFKLISDNQKIIEDPFFVEIIRVISPKARRSWSDLVNVALNRATERKTNPLFMIRNKVVFHYDISEIYSGYKYFFDNNPTTKNPYISLGNDLTGSRFYYSDAAVEGYLKRKIGDKTQKFFDNLQKIMNDLNMSLYFICKTYINKRGFGWRDPEKE